MIGGVRLPLVTEAAKEKKRRARALSLSGHSVKIY